MPASPAPEGFLRAAVAGYARFPGTRVFIRAAVAGYARFPGTPAVDGIHTEKKRLSVTLGLDPRVHESRKTKLVLKMDARVKPEHDERSMF